MFRSAKHWVWLILCWLVLAGQVWAMPCDVDNDGDIDLDDLNLIQKAILARAKVSGANDPRDADGNGVINSIDGRLCALRCTRAKCSTVNQAPFANAGPDQSVKVGDLVVLSGAASSDPDGDALRYTWTFNNRPLGSLASLIEAATVAPRFTADRPGQYLIQLIVSDGKLSSVPDTVIISTENSRPIANAGPDQSVRVGTLVTLNGGRSTDVDGDPLTYTWRLASVPPGSGATLSNPDSVNPTLLIDQPGSYLIALTVSDGKLVSLPATVAVTTENSPPVANSGTNQSIPLGAVITLDGSRSSDVDGDPLTFRWSLLARPPGSAAVLSNANSVHPGFTADLPGTYVAQLIVNDGTADSAPASVTLTTANAAPMADAGPDQTVPLGSLVTLDGSASRDPEGAVLTLTWSLIGKPSGSSASLTGSNTLNPAFTADRPGNYIAQLIVSDGQLASAPDTVTISTANSRPVADAGAPQSVAAGTLVLLDGSASRDADGDALTFAWSLTSLPPGSHAVMTGADLVNPGFVPDLAGTYIAQLIVSDGKLDSLPVTVVVSVTAANRKPIAVAEAIPTKTTVGSSVVLRGTGSSDPDGDPLTWSWSIALRPAGSNSAIVSPTAAQTSFVPDVPGVYTIQLIVRDGKVDSVPALVVVEALAANHPPLITSTAVTSATAGQPYSYAVVASDPDVGDTLTYALRVAPADMTIGATSGLIRWTPPSINAAPVNVTVRVTDQGGLFAEQSFTVTVAQPPLVCAPVPAGMVSWWPFDGNAIDVSDGNNGVLQGSGGGFVPAVTGSGYRSVGGDSIVNVGNRANLNLTQFTIEGWVRLDGILGGGYNMAILWKGNGSGTDITTPFAIAVCGSTCAASGDTVTHGGLQSGTAKLGRPFVMLSNGVIEHQIFTNTVLPVGAFVHLGVTLSDGLVQVYVNGQIDSSIPTAIVPFNSSFPLQIGGVGDPSLHPAGFPGVTDELAIYSRALTGDEIRRIYEAGSAGKCKTGVPPAPIITSAPVLTATAGQAYAYQVTATDANAGDVLSFSLPTAPSGMTINAAIGLIAWTPTLAQVGNQNVTVRVTDSGGLYAEQSFTLAVSAPPPVNQAPVITSIPLIAATPGQPYAYQVVAADPDAGDVLTFSLPTAPAGMTINATTGLIAWTPTLAQLGSHSVTARVTDAAGLYAEQSFTIAARVTNGGPVAVAGLLNAPGLPACVAPPAGLVSWYPGDGNSADIVGPNSPNSTIGNPQFVAGKVGQGIKFDGSTALIAPDDPSVNFGKNDSFTIDAWVRVDGQGGDNADNSVVDKLGPRVDGTRGGYVLDVLNPPFNPTGTWSFHFGLLQNHAANIGQDVFAKPVAYGEFHFVAVTVDRSGQTVSIYMDGVLQQQLSVEHVGDLLTTSRLFIGHQNLDWPGFNPMRPLKGVLDEAEIFNRALSQAEIQSLYLAGSAGKCKLRVGDTVRLDGTRSSDPDADALAYRWTLLARPADSTAALDNANAAQPTFVADRQGSYRLQLVVNDGVADSAPSEISIAVMEGNRPPIALDDNYPVKLGQTLAVPAPGVMANDYDPDGNPLAAAKLSDPASGSLVFNSDGSFNYTPNASVFGPGASAHALVGTTFMPGQPKSIDINPQTNRIYVTNLFAGTLAVIDGATGKVIALPTTNHSHIEEVAANLVTNRLYVTGTAINNYTSSSVQSNEVTVIDGATSTRIAAIPVGNQPGHLAVNAATNRIYVANVAGGSVSVIDGTSNAVLATVPVGREPRQVRVDARTNRIYALSTLDSNVTVIDGASNAVIATVPVGAGARFMAVDAEFERLHVVNGTDNTLTVIDTTLNAAIDTVTVGSGPTAIALHPTIDRLYVANGTGNSVSVLDRHSRANLGTLPVGASPQSITVNPFSNRIYVANAGDNTVSVIDPATTTVSATVGVGRNPQTLAVNPLTDRLYTADADSHSVSVVHVGDRCTYKVNDGTADSNAATVTVVIEPTSVPPVAASDRYTAQAGVLLTVPVPGVLGNDADVAGKALSAALIAGPAGGTLALNANGSFTYLPRNDFVGTDTFTYRASNGVEQSNVATVRVDVTGNGAPVITSTAVTSAMATQPYTYTVTATDPNPSDTLTFLLSTAPAGMSINATTGLITWTPTLAQVGIHPVTIRVADQGGLFAEQDFTIAVTAPGPGNQPPVITSTAPTAATAGTPYTYAVTATDPNPSDTLTFSLTTAPAGMTIAAASGLIQWTPTTAQAGDHPVEVKVQDSGGLFATQPFTVTVSATAVCVPPPAGLVSWWPGDGNTLDRAAANDGLAENGATFAAGLVGQAFRFDGVDDLIRIANSRTVGFGGAFSVEFWFNPTTTIGTSTPNQMLLAKGRYVEGSFNAPVAIQVLGGDGRLLVRMPPAPALVSTTTTWPAGTWQHVALSWDGARYRLYVNGIEEAGLDNAFSIIDSSDPITLGNADGFAAAGFAGLLDEPTLYNRALTPAEIATLHAARGLGKCTATYSRADAGADRAVEVAATVTLDGSASRAFDGAPLTYQWTLTTRPAESAALLANPTTVSPTFVADKAGSYTLDLIVSNAGRASAPDSVTITAARVNHAPTISSTPIIAATAGSAYSYPVAASDPDAGDTLTFSLPVAPAGMSINSASGLIQWTPTTGQIGSHNVSVRVQDPGGLFAVQSFVIVVVAAPVPVTVPNVVGQEQTTAQSAITAASLTVGTVTLAASETVAAGRVISQNPTAGTVVNSGSAVALVVSSGPAGPALASIRVTPIKLLILTGQSQAFAATGILANGSSLPLTSGLTWASSNPAVASIDAAGVVSALAEGSTTISVSQSGITGSTTLNVVQSVADGTLPVAQITSPADGASVATAVPIVGTASDANFLKYVVEIAPFETGVFSTLAVGTAPVSNGTLATLDPTTLVNDLYVVRLTVVDRADNRTQTEITLQLTRDKKVGNFTLAFQDVNVPMAGIPISVVRSYDSRDKTKGDFGIGWRLDVQSLRLRVVGVHGQGWEQVRTGDTLNRLYTLVPRGVHKVAITLPDGKVEEFDLALSPTSQRFVPIEVTDAVYAPRPLTRGSLRALGETRLVTFGATGPLDLLTESGLEVFNPEEFEYTTPEGQVIVLSRSAGVRQIRDRSGNTVTFAPGGITHSAGKSMVFNRDAQNRITTVTDPQGNVQSYAYDINGDLASHTDGEGRRTSFLYNYDHGLIEIQDPRGIRPIRNDYDEAGRLIRTTDAYGKAITYTHDLGANREVITDRLGNATIHVYDDLGNVTQTADALGGVTNRSYDARGNTLSEQDPLGRTRTYTYDGQDNRLTETDALGKTTAYTYNGNRQVLTVTDALGRTTTNAYDGAGNLTSTTDPAGQVTSYTYDARGLQLTRSDPLGSLTRYAYDAAGNLISETDPLGRVTSYSYDANGNRLTQTTTRTTASGPETLVTAFAYDKANRLTQTTHPDDSVTRVAYNAIGKQSVTTDALGRETKFDYDDMGRLTSTTYPDASSETSTYDAEGRRTGSTDRAGRTTTSTYDALGRLTATTYPDSTGSSTAYDAAGQVLTSTDARGNATTYVYDGAGRRTQVIDALGQATSFSYDDLGNQTRVTDANGNAVAFIYDANNRRTRTTYADGTFDQVTYDALGRQTAKTDQAGKTTQFAYDALGRLTRVTDALGQITSYSYDEQGNQLTQTDAEGRSTRFAYDRMGRRSTRTLPLGQTEQMSYDAAGNLRTKTDFNGRTTSYTYDSVNRLLRKTPDATLGQPPVVFSYTPSGQRASMQDASGSTTYSYDNRDRLLSKTTPQGALSYSYDAAGNLTNIHSNHAGGAAMDYAYDPRNRLASVTDANGATTYSYDAVGNLAGFLYPNGVQTTYTYTTLNRLSNVTGARGATLASYTYTLGPTGNRTAVSEASGRRVDYTYDDLYRLKSETISADPAGPNGAIGYTYDKVGNRLARTSTVAGITDQSFEYDFNDRLGGEGYDDNGNTLTSVGKTFGYDFENHLTSADGGVSFVYNGDGIRVAKTAGGVTTGFLVDERNPTGYAQVLEEIVGGAVERSYTYGLTLVSQKQASGVSFYGYDGHGTVRYLTDASGNVTDAYTYDAFGNLIDHTGTTPNDYLYAGEQLDGDLGSYYLRARYYKREVGRFLAADEWPGSRFEPLTFHKYLYTRSNPVDFVDSSGNSWTLSDVAMTTPLISILSLMAWDGYVVKLFGYAWSMHTE